MGGPFRSGRRREAGAASLLLVIEIRRPSKSKESCVTASWSEAGVPIQSESGQNPVQEAKEHRPCLNELPQAMREGKRV